MRSRSECRCCFKRVRGEQITLSERLRLRKHRRKAISRSLDWRPNENCSRHSTDVWLWHQICTLITTEWQRRGSLQLSDVFWGFLFNRDGTIIIGRERNCTNCDWSNRRGVKRAHDFVYDSQAAVVDYWDWTRPFIWRIKGWWPKASDLWWYQAPLSRPSRRR